MLFRSMKNLLASKDVWAQLQIGGIMKFQGSLIFYHAGIETGLFKILEKPSTLEEVIRESNISNTQLLSSLLDMGCALKEISCRKGLYRLKGSMARALAANVPLAALVSETVRYHGDVAQNLDSFLAGNTKGDYLKDFGGVIAESSRILEPIIKAFIYHTVKKKAPLTILEFGCGAGEYLKYYVDINGNNGGIALDKDTSAAAIARQKLRENNIEANFTVAQDNIIHPETIQGKTFDVVTSFSNIYYFSDEERLRLFRAIHALLNRNGRFMLVTAFKTSHLSSAYYDLIFSATEGLYPLPRVNDIVRDLKKAGFSRVKVVNLFGDYFKGVVAYR
ncbi:MAG: hypothetical protein CVV44_18955 [Spirochaetae bacterium HGW-Spirochaetae-1]|nr:MAG: hypothetical protein CVV44_18955 [Spirochaetae bacterium HGW-Spirochaetae-1]